MDVMRQLNNRYWPYRCTVKNNMQFDKMEQWCRTSFGKPSGRWFCYPLYDREIMAAFKEEDDFLMFKLTWSNNNEIS